MQSSDLYSFSRTFCLANKANSLLVAISNKIERKHGLEPQPLAGMPILYQLSYLRGCSSFRAAIRNVSEQTCLHSYRFFLLYHSKLLDFNPCVVSYPLRQYVTVAEITRLLVTAESNVLTIAKGFNLLHHLAGILFGKDLVVQPQILIPAARAANHISGRRYVNHLWSAEESWPTDGHTDNLDSCCIQFSAVTEI